MGLWESQRDFHNSIRINKECGKVGIPKGFPSTCGKSLIFHRCGVSTFQQRPQLIVSYYYYLLICIIGSCYKMSGSFLMFPKFSHSLNNSLNPFISTFYDKCVTKCPVVIFTFWCVTKCPVVLLFFAIFLKILYFIIFLMCYKMSGSKFLCFPIV